MNGPENYAAAERLLGYTDHRMAGDETQYLRTYEQRAFLLAQAQVHATLSLVAAIASTRMTDFQSLIERQHTDVTDDPAAQTWADVIRSTNGDPK